VRLGEESKLFASYRRAARFVLTQYTKIGVKYTKIASKLPNGHKIHIPNGRTILQVAIEYTDLFHFKALQNLPKLVFCLKIYHLATLSYKPILMPLLWARSDVFFCCYKKLCKSPTFVDFVKLNFKCTKSFQALVIN
jgi:hypothetical protein